MITLNQDSCVKCGHCAEVCPAEILGMTEAGPEENRSMGCIACGHCMAICPTGALDLADVPLSEQEPIMEELTISEEKARQFLRSRRSVRSYKKDLVPREKLLKIVDLARLAPTGSNGQGTQFIVIENPAIVDKIREKMAVFFEEWLKSDDPKTRGYRKIIEAYRDGKDTLLRGAPQMILALNEKDNPARHLNGVFALTYAELYAPTLGVGTCWAGFFQGYYGAQTTGEMDMLLEIPPDMTITAALMVGIPKYSYHRLPEREKLNVLWR